MKNIYNIPKGQFIIIWIFGIIGWGLILEDLDSWTPSPFSGFLAWLIPFVLIFYTLGWRKKRKETKSKTDLR